jgi:hypothetical protein
LDLIDIAIDIGVGASEPLPSDALFAGIIGGCHKP